MVKLRCYIGTLLAANARGWYDYPYIGLAQSKELAAAEAMEKCLARFPTSEGWRTHSVSVRAFEKHIYGELMRARIAGILDTSDPGGDDYYCLSSEPAKVETEWPEIISNGK